MERGVAAVGEVRVPDALGVVLDDAFEKGKVFKMDGPTEADGNVNPFCRVFLVLGTERVA